MLKKLVLLVLLVGSAALGQQTTGTVDSYTGNIVYTTVNPPPTGADPFNWSGFGTTYSNGGGYSGGYQPAWNPNTGTFMFGYSQGTVAYTTPVNFALSHAGTGIQVTGLRYSWEYINQDYNRGSLTGNISLTSNIGQTLQSYSYNMPRTTSGWTTMSGTETFNTQYAPSSLGTLNVSFTGKDDRFWAGYYGPQVRAIDVGLTYGMTAPAPVPTNFLRWIPLVNENDTFTLTTAGVVRYGAQGVYEYKSFSAGTYDCSNSAWGNDPIGGIYKSCSLGSNTTTTPTVPKTTTTDYSTVALLDPVTTLTTSSSTTNTVVDPVVSTTSSTTASSQPTAVASVVSAPTPAITQASSTSSSSTTSSSSQSSKETTSSGGSTSLALSIISKNSDRDAAGAAVAQSAVAQAQAVANQAQQEAQSVAATAVANSTTANAVSSGGPQSSGSGLKIANTNSNSTNFSLPSGQTSMVSLVGGPQSTNTAFVQQQNSGNLGLNISNNQPVLTTATTQLPASTEPVAAFALPLLQPQQASNVLAPMMFAPVEQALVQQTTTLQNTNTTLQSIETYSIVPPNFLTDRTNPLTDIVEGKGLIPQSNTANATGPSVNKSTGDNEVAGGVDINRMALAPAGFNEYLNLTLRDAAFYAPREVYRNQRNVDNARALRQLSSDRLHQDLVNLQYK